MIQMYKELKEWFVAKPVEAIEVTAFLLGMFGFLWVLLFIAEKLAL